MSKHKNIKFLILLMVAPIIIGHGLGTPSWPCKSLIEIDNCRDFTISGSADINSNINVPDKLVFYENVNLIYTIDNVNSNVNTTPPIEFDSNQSYPIKIHTSLLGNSNNLGELWLHYRGNKSNIFDDSKKLNLKLLHPALSPSKINIDFIFDKSDFDISKNSTISGSSIYTLSSGPTGSEQLTFSATMNIQVNGNSIYSRINTDNNISAPITFSANINDILQIEMGDLSSSYNQGTISSIWLHNPSGSGVKLIQGGEIKQQDNISLENTIRYSLTN